MNRIRLRRPSASLVISLLALFIALGGTVYAASKISGTQIKKGSIPGNRLKKHSLTGTQINLGKLGTVPNATNAVNATNATNATSAKTAQGLTGYSPFFKTGVLQNEVVTLVDTGQFKVVGICDPADTLVTPGFEATEHGTRLGIIDEGQNGGTAGSDDDSANPFNVGQGIAFNFLDTGDEGEAALPNGHFIAVDGALTADKSETGYAMPGDCTFSGFARFN